MLALSLSVIVSIQFTYLSVNAYQCRDMNNQPVDWWAISKLPIGAGVPGVTDGMGFYYMDINNKRFTLATVSIADPKQAVAYTMAQYYSAMSDPNTFHVMYNDEPPATKEAEKLDKKAVEHGHTKGVSFFNSATGIWMVHSVPKFPKASSWEWPPIPPNNEAFAQSMLCISMNYTQLASIGTQLYYNHPTIYSSMLPASMAQANPDLANVIAKRFQRGANTTSIKPLVSAGGTAFTSFAKTADFNADLYDGLVAPKLGVSLLVETWRRGDEIPLACHNPQTVVDVQNVHVLQSNAYFHNKDHSKFAVSTVGTQPFVCIGDINRMTSQYKRGGGTVCMNDFFVWTAYKGIVVDTNHC